MVKAKWLPGMARGDQILPSRSQRRGAVPDAAGMQTRAVRHGDEYILSGEKSGISMVMPADAVVVFAKTDMDAGARGVSAFLVPTDLPGLSRTPCMTWVSARSSAGRCPRRRASRA